MAPAVVHLHIGSPKTGTTYIQDVLWANREALEEDGVLLPGHYRYARVEAARDLVKWDREDGDLPETWRRLVGEVNRWSGRSAVISQEFLCWASPDQISAMVQSFRKSRVEIVLTVRDLARLVPAQWQTAMRQRNTWTLEEYAAAVAGSDGQRAKTAARHFWRRQDYGPILQRFVDEVGVDHVRVVTLPPSGGDPAELWHRFCQACDIDPAKTTPGGMSHESLGAVSAELMRRLNAHPTIEEMPIRAYQKSVNGALTRRVLSHRRSLEPGLALPETYADWAEREAARLIADIEAVGVEVVGDLDDLRPRPGRKVAVAPEAVPDADLLEAALDGLAGLAAEHAELMQQVKRAQNRGGGHKGRQNQGGQKQGGQNRSQKGTKAGTPAARRSFLGRARRAVSRTRAAWRRRRPRR